MLACMLEGSGWAKEASLTAIELYDGPNGAAYVQLADLEINGKAEVRACGDLQRIDKSAYSKLAKVLLTGATSLERDSDGVMMITRDSVATCVVPANLKLEKNNGSTPAELAELAVLNARILSSSPGGPTAPPPLKRGVKIQFVPAADLEFAEYLRADRARSIAVWQDYLGKYASSAHGGQAKQSLAGLLVKEGEVDLATYRKSASNTATAYPPLKAAKAHADQARELVPAYPAALKLRDDVRNDLGALTEKSHAEFQAYKTALAARTPGYVHLINARNLAVVASDIDPQFDQLQTLLTNISTESRSMESAMSNAGALMSTQRVDEALTAVSAYVEFTDEDPRIAGIVNGAYDFHLAQGAKFASGEKWQEAIRELRKAIAIKTTPEAAVSLKNAEQGLQTAKNRADADAALEESAAFESQHQNVEAYEVLADLPEAPRALVADRLQSLEDAYIKGASQEAKILQQANTPIRGRADEIGAERAYSLLQGAYVVGQEQDNNLKLRLDLLAETISDYYLERAKRYLEKPDGSGVGLAWEYLDLAQQYKPNRDDVRDERTKSTAMHQMRSKLSIRVEFLDQTSRRDSAGWAEQLSDAIATGMETSSLSIRVVRSNDRTTAEPNFQLVGDVLQHRPTLTSTVEAKDSKYRFSSRDIPNEEWNKANRDYETANLDLESAQRASEGAQAHGKKKEIAEANANVAAAEKKVQDAHRTLDSIPKTNSEEIDKPYTYTKKTFDLSAVVELDFRILNSAGDVIEVVPPFKKENHNSSVVLENVKPEDTEGIKNQGSPPDEIQFLDDVEDDARDTLIKAVREKVEDLPAKVLKVARERVKNGDLDGAAESYILYLNATTQAQTQECGEARKFLLEDFNIRDVTSSPSQDLGQKELSSGAAAQQ